MIWHHFAHLITYKLENSCSSSRLKCFPYPEEYTCIQQKKHVYLVYTLMNCAYEFTRSPVGYIFLLLFSLYFDALCISIHLLDTAKSNSGSALSVNLSSNNREKYCKCRKERYKLGIEVTILMIQKGIKEHARSDGYQVMVELRRVMCLIKDVTSCVAVRDLFQTLCGCFALHLLIEKLCVLLSSETRMPEISSARQEEDEVQHDEHQAIKNA